jgi:CheY-like chemotaxis protein
MLSPEHQRLLPDRRRVSRGGRRQTDRAGKYPSILVAESYDGVRRCCARYLDCFHFQVAEATDGEEALKQITVEPPRVILAELNLPAISASHLVQWLSQGWRTRQIPVIVLTGDLDPADPTGLDHFKDAVAGVLVKPFALGSMLEEIRRVIRAEARV